LPDDLLHASRPRGLHAFAAPEVLPHDSRLAALHDDFRYRWARAALGQQFIYGMMLSFKNDLC